MTIDRALGALTALLAAALAAGVLAACGSSSSPTATGTAAASTGGSSTSRAKLPACLKQHGVPLRAVFGRGAAPAGGGAPGSGKPPKGGSPQGRHGAGKGDSARFQKMQAALKACGANFRGRGGFGGPGGRGNFKPTPA